jgi:hypothetical protein
MKIGPVGAELFHADGRTERQAYMTKLIVAFRSFANAPKNSAAATTVHLHNYQAEWLRALQKKTKYVWNLYDVSDISRYAVPRTLHTWYGRL